MIYSAKKNKFKTEAMGAILVFFGVIADTSSFALTSDEKLPTQLRSNSAICKRQNNENICTYSGNAQLNQGTTNLQAEQITIYQINSKINKMVASGKSSHYSNTPDDNPQQPVNAYADSITVYPDKKLMILAGNGQLLEETSILQAQQIISKTNKIIALGKDSHYNNVTKSTPNNNQQPFSASADSITIYPNKKLMVLEGNGQLIDGQNKYSGPYTEYTFK